MDRAWVELRRDVVNMCDNVDAAVVAGLLAVVAAAITRGESVSLAIAMAREVNRWLEEEILEDDD